MAWALRGVIGYKSAGDEYALMPVFALDQGVLG
jgi:hypothetical protein